jgi:hypothetical protein
MDAATLLARIGTAFLNVLVAHYGPDRAAEMPEQWTVEPRATAKT